MPWRWCAAGPASPFHTISLRRPRPATGWQGSMVTVFPACAAIAFMISSMLSTTTATSARYAAGIAGRRATD